MSNINFNVEDLNCDNPVISDAHFVIGTENFYSVSWTSNGIYLNSVDPVVVMELWFSIDGGNFQPYLGNPVNFNQVDLQINFNNIQVPIQGVMFELRMMTPFCGNIFSNQVYAPSIA